MNTKLLLLLGAAAGLLLLFFLWPGVEDTGPESASELLESGHFLLEFDGLPILEESYTLEYDAAAGYLLNSKGSILSNGETITLAQQTQYDREFLPINYQLAANTPSGTQIVSAQMGLRGFDMEVRVGLSVQNAKVTDLDNLALLDNNLIGQFAVLLRAIRAEAIDRQFTAAIPQALLSLPARIKGPNTITFYSGEQEYEGKRFDLQLGDTILSLVEYDGKLAGILNRTQGTVGYDLNLCPSGIRFADEVTAKPMEEGVERTVDFASGELTLSGTLRLPAVAEGPLPAILFIHGSGPVDRDGNAVDPGTGAIVMEIDAYRQLAVALSDVGVASFRFDKRGVGASEGEAAMASRSDLLADVRAAISALRTQPEIDPDRIILAGHSEGGYLAPLIAVEDEAVAGVILLAGAARDLGAITRWQVESLLAQQGIEGMALEAALAQQDQYIAFIKASEGEWSDYSVDALQAEIPWLTADVTEQLVATPLALSWLREHYLADPAITLRQLVNPVLIISGEKDLQVPASEAPLIEALLLEAGNEDITVSVLPDLNHLLRYHPEEPNLTYRHINEPVDPRVLETVQTWMLERFGA